MKTFVEEVPVFSVVAGVFSSLSITAVSSTGVSGVFSVERTVVSGIDS